MDQLVETVARGMENPVSTILSGRNEKGRNFIGRFETNFSFSFFLYFFLLPPLSDKEECSKEEKVKQ